MSMAVSAEVEHGTFNEIPINCNAFDDLESDSANTDTPIASNQNGACNDRPNTLPPFPNLVVDPMPQQNVQISKERTHPLRTDDLQKGPLPPTVEEEDDSADETDSDYSSRSVESSSTDSDTEESTESDSLESEDDENGMQFTDCITSQKISDWDHDQIQRVNAKYNHFYVETLKSPKYIMAPMVSGSELPFRMMARKYGCNLCYSPMVSAHSIIETFKRCGNLDHRLRFHPDDRPLIVQLCSNDKDEIVEAVKIIQGLGDICDGIDINLGCPKTIAKSQNWGAFLLDDAQTVRSMMTALCKQCSLPITAKIRILESLQETLAFTDMLVESGISMLAVHGRRREEEYWHKSADLNMIRQIKRHYKDHYGLNLPVISNGNIMTLHDADNNLKFTGCDAVMSAYGLLRNPFLFDPKQTALEWTVERGIEASWEYLEMVKKYGVNHGNPVRYHLDKLNHTFFNDECEGPLTINKKKLWKILRREDFECGDDITEWSACVKIMEMMMGKKAKVESVKLPNKKYRKYRQAMRNLVYLYSA